MYTHVKDLLPISHCKKLADIIRRQPIKEGDEQVYGSYTYYNLAEVNIILGVLLPRISKETNKNLFPTYSYCRIYNNGDELKKHRDRKACEWSVTINLSQSDPWPIYIENSVFDIQPGDGVIYKGCDVTHWREPFKGTEYIQIFLHYVDTDGPFNDQILDFHTNSKQKPELDLRITKTNKNTSAVWTKNQVFMPHECKAIVNEFYKKSYNKGMVGDQNTNLLSDIRRSLIYWIPKIEGYSWIYKRVIDVIIEANKENYEFDLHGIIESIQFTEYDSKDDGYYGWHTDEAGTGRKLSMSIQLSDSDAYEGGTLQIRPGHFEANREIGSATVFPSHKLHQVTPVTKGIRHALVVWISGPPFR